ncbi:MAG TPA: radical SAM protein, partial [Tissierellaceae bacterium]
RQKGVIATGAMSDPYNKLEETINLTRDALKIIKSNGFGVFIMTKSDLIIRDIDILKEIKQHSPVVVAMTITSFDDDLAKIVEPFAPSTSRRFEALEILKSEGIYAGIMLMPVLPFINDNEENIIKIVNKSKQINLDFIYPSFGVTLRDNQRDYYFDKLDKSFPNLKDKYIKTYGNNYYCEVKNKKKLEDIFAKLNKNNEIITDIEKINIDYRSRYKKEQLSLFNFNKEV